MQYVLWNEPKLKSYGCFDWFGCKLIKVAKWSSRFRFSTEHFLRAAEKIFTQQSIKDVL